MQVRKSEYYDIARFAPVAQSHPADILVQSYTAVSVSDSTIRFNVRAPSYRALMSSEALIFCPMKLDFKPIKGKEANGGDANDLITPIDSTAVDDYARTAALTSALGSTQAVAPVVGGNLYPDDNANKDWIEQCQIPCREASDAHAAKNATFCERTSGFWKSVQSCVLEINGQSISARPEEYIHLLDELMLDEQEQRSWPQGPKDEGSDGRFIGRCKTSQYNRGAQNTQTVSAKDPRWKLDEKMNRRCQIFRDRYEFDNVYTRPGGNALTAFPGVTGKYLAVARIPFGGIFSYFRKGLGSSRMSYIPYCQNFSLLINFKPGSLQFANMFQISAASGRPESGASSYRMGAAKVLANYANPNARGGKRQLNQVISPTLSKMTISSDDAPRLQLRWVNPAESVSLAPSYTLSLPRFVTYKRELSKAAMFSDAGAPCFFSSIRLETLPKVMLLSCVPKEVTSIDDTFYTAAGGNVDDDDNPLFALGTMRGCLSYQDTFDCLPPAENDWDSAQLKVTINERSSLCSTYSARTLYDLLLENFPRYPHSYEVWRREKMIIALAPHQIPSLKMMGAYSPTSLTIELRFKASVRHNPPIEEIGGGLAMTLSGALDANAKFMGVPHVASLVCVYEDSLSLASNSAAVSATLFSETALKRAPMGKGGDAPGLDGMKM